MTENKRFTVIRKKNQVSKQMGNYVQDRGTTILKLSFLEDCKDVCDILNELNDEIMELQKQNNTFKHFISEIIKNIQSKDDNQLLYIQSILHQLE